MDDRATLSALAALAARGDVRDRAFVDANLRLLWARTKDAAERAALTEIHRVLGVTSARVHAELRSDIAAGRLRGAALRGRLEEATPIERDHFVEEVLGVAYPPLEENALGPELISYTPSGYDEIVHAFDVTKLSAGDRFLDIGAGTGKVVLLAATLTGAKSAGLECEAALVDVARSAAESLALARDVRFDVGDARDAPLADADVVFMYLPFTGTVLATVMTRILEGEARHVCAGALDLARHPSLVPVGEPRSWLHVYERRAPSTRSPS